MNLLENDTCIYSSASQNDQNSQKTSACNGCQLWSVPYFEQLESKKNDLKNKLNTDIALEVKTAGPHGLRTRFDFTYEDGKMGLYSLVKEQDKGFDKQPTKNLVDLEGCAQLTPELLKAYIALKKITFPFKKGSLRLRVSPDDKWGLWLDLANVDIKSLLIEKKLLTDLSKQFELEIGQKRKTIDFNVGQNEQLKLKEPQPYPWFSSLNNALYCAISSFTQPGWKTGDLLIETVLKWTSSVQTDQRIYEYGCGIGPFTLQLLKKGHHVHVFENDLFALECLKLNCAGYTDKLSLNTDYDHEIHTALVNPPRSGLQNFSQILQDKKPKKIIYISCYPDSFKKDLDILSKDYSLTDVTLVDQFPQTSHYEVCALLQRID